MFSEQIGTSGTRICLNSMDGEAGMPKGLEGTVQYAHIVKAGETLVMPAKVPHAVYGEEAFKWVLTVVFPDGFEA